MTNAAGPKHNLWRAFVDGFVEIDENKIYLTKIKDFM